MFRKSTVCFSWPDKMEQTLILPPASKVSAARLQLVQEENAEAEKGKEALDKVSASVFVRMGLELEDQQYAIVLVLFFSCLISK